MLSNIRTLVDDLNVSREISPADFMYVDDNQDHYFSVGRSALRAVMACLTAVEEYGDRQDPIAHILDYGCGYGRVCRFLRAAYPAANIAVTDVNAEAVRFCADSFGCTAVDLQPPADSFDLIWVGSVLTHLAEPVVTDMLLALVGALRPGGVLVFTTHGRYSHMRHYRQPEQQFYIPGRLANDRIAAGYLHKGFGFSGHANTGAMATIDPGISIIDPRWIHQTLCACTGLMQVFFQERGWDFHQDVYGFARYELLGSR